MEPSFFGVGVVEHGDSVTSEGVEHARHGWLRHQPRRSVRLVGSSQFAGSVARGSPLQPATAALLYRMTMWRLAASGIPRLLFNFNKR